MGEGPGVLEDLPSEVTAKARLTATIASLDRLFVIWTCWQNRTPCSSARHRALQALVQPGQQVA